MLQAIYNCINCIEHGKCTHSASHARVNQSKNIQNEKAPALMHLPHHAFHSVCIWLLSFLLGFRNASRLTTLYCAQTNFDGAQCSSVPTKWCTRQLPQTLIDSWTDGNLGLILLSRPLMWNIKYSDFSRKDQCIFKLITSINDVK